MQDIDTHGLVALYYGEHVKFETAVETYTPTCKITYVKEFEYPSTLHSYMYRECLFHEPGEPRLLLVLVRPNPYRRYVDNPEDLTPNGYYSDPRT